MTEHKFANMSSSDRCRVCLETSEKLYPLQGPIANCDVEIDTMITYCTSIEVELSDDLPAGVCVPCFRTVRIAYNFILQFRENHHKLIGPRSEMEQSTRNDYLYVKDVYTVPDNNDNTIENKNQIMKEYEIIENTQDSENFISNQVETEDFLKQEGEEIISYEEIDEQEGNDEQTDFEEYDQRDVEMNNINFLVENLEETIEPDASDNFQHVTVKVIKQSPLPEIRQPQTVLRRKIKVRFACPICPKVYFGNFENGLVPHMSQHEEHFTCNVCSENTVLYNADSFLNHFMQYHRYQCPYCGKSYNKTGTLTAHIKTHYKFTHHCSHEGCSKSFPTLWSLRKHEAVHSNSFAYTCTECNMEFKTYDTYMYHQKKHGGRKFLCMCCGRTFLQSVHLKYHMQQHTGIKHFKCNWCVKSYTSSSQLKKHKRRHHPDQLDNNKTPNSFVDIDV